MKARTLICIAAALAIVLAGVEPAVMNAAQTEVSKSNKKKQSAKKTSTSKATSKKATSKSGKNNTKKQQGSKTQAAPTTSADAKRRKQQAEQEIRLTKEQIEANDRAVRAGLADLGKLSGDIDSTKRQVNETSAKVKSLGAKIGSLQKQVEENRAQLEKMRKEYLKAVKKMRASKGSNSALAFVFASKNFNQAMRRMRYLKEFSDWREKQSAQINAKVQALNYQTQLLEQTKSEHDVQLSRQMAAQSQLQSQYAKQENIVAGLKKNGQALKDHLARKQQEANTLNSQISNLIAQEERKAREAEEAKRREAERVAQQKAEAEKAAAAQKAAEEKAAQEKKSAEEKKTAEPKKETPKKEEKKKEEKKKDTKTKEEPKQEKNYAEARKRESRKQTPATSEASGAASSGSGFESMRGSLPKPTNGSFKVTSPFGRHPLPDLPDVVYDNPGIDAEVSDGASALAVYGGRVSGVYVLPGYSTVVIVAHGNYYTVYGNIASPTVKTGDTVKAGQSLGTLARDDNNRTSIHFEVWKNRDKLNPMNWIR